jgi:hypothetical protein
MQSERDLRSSGGSERARTDCRESKRGDARTSKRGASRDGVPSQGLRLRRAIYARRGQSPNRLAFSWSLGGEISGWVGAEKDTR